LYVLSNEMYFLWELSRIATRSLHANDVMLDHSHRMQSTRECWNAFGGYYLDFWYGAHEDQRRELFASVQVR